MICKAQGKQIVHFLHIGKTGGSAIKDTLEKSPAKPRRYFIFLRTHGAHLKHIRQGEKVFFFLRDPVSRFVSGFYGRQRQDQPRYFVPWSPGERAAFERFQTPNQLALALSSPEAEEQEEARKAMGAIQHVSSSYWDWFGDPDYFLSRKADIFFIGRQHRLKEDFAILKAKLGLPEDLELPDGDTRAHRNPAGLSRALDAAAETNLKEWYKKDYEFLALCESLIPTPAEPQDVPSGDRA